MNLNISIAPSEKEISSIIGKDKWLKLINKSNNTDLKCCYCNYPDKENNFKRINLKPKLRHHLLPFNKELNLTEEFEKLEIVIVCDACHAIQHFDIGVKNKWFKLVNSNFDQVDLIKICRWGNKMVNGYILGGEDIDKNIFLLKKSPEAYLAEINESNLNFNEKIKIIFTKNFDWSNCR